jgi:hypothetical protein
VRDPRGARRQPVLRGVAHGDRGTVAFIADDENAARKALQTPEIDYIEREALTARLQNVPGGGAATFRRLLEPCVNLEVFLPVRIFDEEFYAVNRPDNMAAALAALGDQMVAASPSREVRHLGSGVCDVVQSSMAPTSSSCRSESGSATQACAIPCTA